MYDFEPFDKILVRDNDSQLWNIDFFSCYDNGTGALFTAGGISWNQAIPYEGNEHLVGTYGAPEQEFREGELVAFSDDKKVWYIGFFSKKLREGKLRYVGYRASDGSYVSQYQYCEPAKNHFNIFMSEEK